MLGIPGKGASASAALLSASPALPNTALQARHHRERSGRGGLLGKNYLQKNGGHKIESTSKSTSEQLDSMDSAPSNVPWGIGKHLRDHRCCSDQRYMNASWLLSVA